MISDAALLKLAEAHGTPLYVYDGDMVLEHYRALFDFIPHPRLRIHYALKANYNPALLTILRDAGASLDAVSPAEVILALKLGFPKERIIFTANNLTDAEVSSLSLQMICYAKNEIYARRGYIFQSQELRDYFGSKSWYFPTVPAQSFSDQVFNNIEMTNIGLLKKYEYSINPNGYQLY